MRLTFHRPRYWDSKRIPGSMVLEGRFLRLSKAMETPREQAVKNSLTAEEKAEILSMAESSVKRDDMTALCVYGSRVAGYSREDSDYDVIIVTRGPKEVKSKEGKAEAHEKEPKSR